MYGKAVEEGQRYVEVRDVIASDVPQLYKVNELTTKLKGSTNEFSKVLVMKDFQLIGEGYTNYDFHFSIDIPSVEISDRLKVIAVDEYGNRSEPKEVIVEKGAPTELTGSHSGNLFAENGPYILNGAVKFNDLIIEPGIEFIPKDDTYSHITIGQMTAKGRPDDTHHI